MKERNLSVGDKYLVFVWASLTNGFNASDFNDTECNRRALERIAKNDENDHYLQHLLKRHSNGNEIVEKVATYLKQKNANM